MPHRTFPALSLVIPVYNSVGTLPRLVERVGRLDVPGGLELILVNDGSSDGSGQACRLLADAAAFPLTAVDLSRNFGEHNAVMAGLRHARGKHVVIMDDDFQNPFGEAVRLWEHAVATGCDVVYSAYDEKRHSAWRNWGSRMTNSMADLLLDKPPGLYLSSFKCLSAFAVTRVLAYEGPFPYLDGLIFQVSQKVDTLRVAHEERAGGRSGYTLRKLIRLWLSVFLNFSIMPLRVATIMGLGIAGLGFTAALGVVIEALVSSTPSGWGSLMAGLLVFSGIQLVMLGLIGEYLGRIHLTLNGKPQYVIREVRRGGQG